MNNTKIENILLKIFFTVFIIVMGTLTILAFIFSYKNIELAQEYVFRFRDNIILNAVALLVIVGIAVLAKKKLAPVQWIANINIEIFAIVVALISVVLCVLWVLGSGAEPQADQWKMCNAAVMINNGDYSWFEKGEYIARNQHQLGIVTILRVLFYIFGEWNYLSFQILNCIGVGLTIFYTYNIAKVLTDNKAAELISLLGIFICLPLYFYTAFVYGEILSIAMSTIGIYLFFALYKEFNYKRLAAFIFVVVGMLWARKNTVVILIAMLGIPAVKLLIERKKKYLLIIAAITVGMLIKSLVISALYDSHFPEDAYDMPSILYIAMGTNDYENRGGWYDGVHIAIYERNDFVPEAASDDAKQVIVEFLKQCVQDPVYGVKFYTRKILSQWIAPMYQGIVMNNNVTGEQSNFIHFLYYDSRAWDFMDGFMNILQLLVYVSVVYLVVDSWKNTRNLEFYMGLIAVFGGFLFSIIWEAKTRYVFPYFIIMIPYATIGFNLLVDNIYNKVFQKQNAEKS